MAAPRSAGGDADGVALGSASQSGDERDEEPAAGQGVEIGHLLGQPHRVPPGQQHRRPELEPAVVGAGPRQADERVRAVAGQDLRQPERVEAPLDQIVGQSGQRRPVQTAGTGADPDPDLHGADRRARTAPVDASVVDVVVGDEPDDARRDHAGEHAVDRQVVDELVRRPAARRRRCSSAPPPADSRPRATDRPPPWPAGPPGRGRRPAGRPSASRATSPAAATMPAWRIAPPSRLRSIRPAAITSAGPARTDPTGAHSPFDRHDMTVVAVGRHRRRRDARRHLGVEEPRPVHVDRHVAGRRLDRLQRGQRTTAHRTRPCGCSPPQTSETVGWW